MVRPRRLRQTPALRDLVAEVHLQVTDLVMPFFILPGRHQERPIASMPGIAQLSWDNALIEIDQGLKMGLRAVMLFGVPDEKDADGSAAYDDNGVIQQATRQIKAHFGQDVVVMTDTCLCEYTNHGHCGMVLEGKVLNDPTLEVLSRVAVSQAMAGADIVCPSDMMDGRVQAIRWALDDNGLTETALMAYAVKFASHLYAPFRDAAGSTPSFGDRRTYQMDYRNRRESLLETDLDVLEGADMLMVKPALGYLDVLSAVAETVDLPVVAYNVSGEYGMVKAAAQQGWIQEEAVVLELLTGIKRAGARLMVTYHAREAARWLQQQQGGTA